MITLDVEQGSPEWLAARLGIPTASSFDRILTPGTRKLSKGADSYMHELLAEWMIGASLDPYANEWMERGKDLELGAVEAYEFERDCETERVGFAMRDDRRCGASPDRFVGLDGGLEIKCPSAAVHVSYLLGVPTKYNCQVQGALWITERDWWDFMSFHPDMPRAIVRIPRDEPFIRDISAAVEQFCDRLESARETLRMAGAAPRVEAVF